MSFSNNSMALPKLVNDTNLVLIYSAIKASKKKKKSDKEFSHSIRDYSMIYDFYV